MKPDWKDAPDWAQWLFMESDGAWYWAENAPQLTRNFWQIANGKYCVASPSTLPVWEKTKEPRP